MFHEKMSEAIDRADKEDLQTAVAMLRAFRGWSQADLALAAGLGASAVSRYESGAQEPSLRTFDRIVKAVGLRTALVRSLLTWIHKARAEVLGGELPHPMDDFIESSALELVEAFSSLLRSAARDLEASRRSARPLYLPVEELWKELKEVPVEDRPVIVEAVEDLRSWQFCVFLCDRSLEAAREGNGTEALEIARLAVHSAERNQVPGTWKLRLKGYALAHLAAALRASGDFGATEETLQHARSLWDAGEPEGPWPLDEVRLLELESARRVEWEEV